MQKTRILVLGVLILFMFTTNAPAATIRIIDVIHLNDGSKVTGEIIEHIPNDYVKIETINNEIKTYRSTQINKMKVLKVRLNLNRTTATLRAALFPSIPFLFPIFTGWGQFYNGQYSKGLGFLANSLIGVSVILASGKPDGNVDNTTAAIGASMVVGGYILSIVDANLSAKKINELSHNQISSTKIKNSPKQDVPTLLNLNYIPHGGWMASYSFGF